MLFITRVDGVPLQGNDQLTFEIQRWMITLVDTINTSFESLEPLVQNNVTITKTSQVADVNTIYYPSNVALTSLILPATCIVGSRFSIRGQGSGGWELLPSPMSGQTIKIEGVSAATSIASANRYDSIDITCVVESSVFVVNAYVSSGLIIT